MTYYIDAPDAEIADALVRAKVLPKRLSEDDLAAWRVWKAAKPHKSACRPHVQAAIRQTEERIPQPGDVVLIREPWAAFPCKANAFIKWRNIDTKGRYQFRKLFPETMPDHAATLRVIESVEGPVRVADVEQHVIWKILGNDINPGGSPPPGSSFERAALDKLWRHLYPQGTFAHDLAWLLTVRAK